MSKIKKEKKPLAPEQKRIMKHITVAIVFFIALGMSLSVLHFLAFI